VTHLDMVHNNINASGDVVVQRNQALRNVQKLREKLVKNGYSPDEIDAFLHDKDLKQAEDMQKAARVIIFNKSDFQIVPKAFN